MSENEKILKDLRMDRVESCGGCYWFDDNRGACSESPIRVAPKLILDFCSRFRSAFQEEGEDGGT